MGFAEVAVFPGKNKFPWNLAKVNLERTTVVLKQVHRCVLADGNVIPAPTKAGVQALRPLSNLSSCHSLAPPVDRSGCRDLLL
jgi:hypothetical protein